MSSKNKVAMGVVGQLVKAAKPGMSVAVAAGVGAVAAQLGGELLKEVPQVAAFAHGGQAQEAVVDLAGGVAIDAVVLIGAGMVWGPRATKQLAPFVIGGTVLSALAPLVAPYVEHLVDQATHLIGGAMPHKLLPGGYGDGVIDVIPGGVSNVGMTRDLY